MVACTPGDVRRKYEGEESGKKPEIKHRRRQADYIPLANRQHVIERAYHTTGTMPKKRSGSEKRGERDMKEKRESNSD